MNRKPAKVKVIHHDDKFGVELAWLEQAAPDSPTWHKRGFKSDVYPPQELQAAIADLEPLATLRGGWPEDRAEALALETVTWECDKYQRLSGITLRGRLGRLITFKIETWAQDGDELGSLLDALWAAAEAFLVWAEEEAAQEAEPDLFGDRDEEDREGVRQLRDDLRTGRVEITFPDGSSTKSRAPAEA